MKPAFFLFLSLVFAFRAEAQTVQAQLDISRREPTPLFFEYVAADGGLVTLGNERARTSRYQAVTKYDAQFQREWTETVLEQNGHRAIDFLAVLGDNIFVFVSEYFPRERTIRTWYTQYDLAGNLIEKEKVIAEAPNEKEHRADLEYSLSLNKKKLVCYKILNRTNEPESILHYTFDATEGLEDEGEIKLPYRDDQFYVRQLEVSNQGNLYLLGKHYANNRVIDPDDYAFVLFRKEKGSQETKHVTLSKGELYLSDLSFKIDRSENLFLAGFFSHNRSDAIVGTVFQKLSPQMEEITSSTQRFTEEFLSIFLTEKQIERGKELRNFYLDNIILRSDGGVLMVAEKFYTSYNSYLDIYGYWVDRKVYHYDDIIVNSVSADGELEWSAAVAKNQVGENQDFLSYTDVVSGTNLYLLYTYQPRRQAETIYFNTVDPEGKVTERAPLLPEGYSERLFPRESVQISNNSALLLYYNSRSRVYSIVKVAFDEE